jgi:rhodanese-related sulfurtransferase
MAGRIDAPTLKAWLSDGGEIALIDVREHGQYGEGHPFFAVSVPYSRLEIDLPKLVPNPAVRLVLCDGGDGVAERAAARLERLRSSCNDGNAYASVSILDAGVASWRDAGFTLYAGVNVPSKAFGELVEHARHTPRVTAAALKAMQDAGDDLAILDGRTFAEFRRMSIPGGVSCPNGELALRVGELVPNPETRIVVNCAGRTRSIIGAQTLIDLGIPNPVYALENGTQGWFLAGLALDHGASRRSGDAPPPPDRLAALQARARELAEAYAVGFVGIDEAAGWRNDPSRTTYFLDVRTAEEFAASPVPSFTHAPGGQLVQATDHWVGVRGGRIVLLDDELVRAPMAAQWLRQQGHEAYVLDVGSGRTWPRGAGLTMKPCFLHSARTITPAELADALSAASVQLIDLRPSMSYRKEHIDGAAWSIRPRITAAVADPARPVVLIAEPEKGGGPSVADLATIDLGDAGVRDVLQLAGGHAAARAAGLAMAAAPDIPADADCIDFLFFTHDRHDGNAAAARQYLAWELGLLAQLDAQERGVFRVGAAR